MGRFAVRPAAALEGVKEVVVADLHADAAKSFAASVGRHVRGQGLDITDGIALRNAMKNADAVLNTVGPFYTFGPPVLRAAIESGCHYLDICDDWEPTLEMLAMDGAAREAQVTAVVGLGASPGLSNLLGRIAMEELDSVREVYTGWNINAATPEEESSQSRVNAAMEHAIRQMTGTVRVHRDGTGAMVRSLEKVEIDYPGLGRQTARIFGHPEAITFPHHYPELQVSMNLAHGMEKNRWIFLGLRNLVDWRLLPEREAARFMGWLEGLNSAPGSQELMRTNQLPPIFGLAVGTKNGQAASAAAAFASASEYGMGYATGVPLACGLELLIQGSLSRRGVFAPESGAIDPAAFLTALARKESGPETDTGETLILTRSWESDARERYAEAMKKARA